MDNLYYNTCCTLPNLADDELGDWFSYEEALAFTQNVYEGKYRDGSIDRKRTNKYAAAFSQAVDKGWMEATGLTQIDYDSPDAKMIAALKDNVFHFSAAKNRAEIEALSALLIDANGKRRNFKDFEREAMKVTTDFQGRYLKVEYDNAINSAYLAARWQEFEEDDILVFRTAGDGRVRDSHKALDGIALPKSHPFWRTFYPPLAWNCRCTVEVSHSARITPEGEIPYGEIDNVPPIFRSNFAVEGMAFPPNHPYFKETSLIDAKWHHSTTPYQIDETPNGNKIYESKSSNKYSKSATERARQKIEYTQNRITARLMADYYNDDVLLMPEISEPNKDIRYVWEYQNRGHKFKPKMADSFLLRNKKFYEVKSYEGQYSYDKLSKMVNRVQEQAEIGVLYINQDIPIEVVKNNLKTYINTLTKNKKVLKSKELFAVVNGRIHKIF